MTSKSSKKSSSSAQRCTRFSEHDTLAQLGSFLRLDKYKVSFPLFEKPKMSTPRELVNVHRGDAVAGLLHIKVGSEQYLLLVKQFRMPTLIDPDTGMPDMAQVHASEGAGRLLELMAGTRNPGEPWLEAFRRECKEETDLDMDEVVFINSFYPSPGACSEQIHLYYGCVNWPSDKAWPPEEKKSHGDETEDIERHFIAPNDFIARIERGEILDGKCLVAAEWMRRSANRDLFELKDS